jgi:hypothetical protein
MGPLVDREALARCRDDVERAHAKARHASPRFAIPAHAAAQQIAADRHVRAVRERKRETVGPETLAQLGARIPGCACTSA